MTRAVNDLKTSSESVAAIGEAAGYHSEGAFQRAFNQRDACLESRADSPRRAGNRR